MNNKMQIGDIESYISDKTQIVKDEEMIKKNRNRRIRLFAFLLLIIAQFILIAWQIHNLE
jgi:hypothetical protein